MGEYLDSDPDEDRRTGKTCRNCGETGLEWDLHDGNWRLHQNGMLHKCDLRVTWKKEISGRAGAQSRVGAEGYAAWDRHAIKLDGINQLIDVSAERKTIGEYLDSDQDEHRAGKTCKNCGEVGLEWMRLLDGKWRLAKDNVLHNCFSKEPVKEQTKFQLNLKRMFGIDVDQMDKAYKHILTCPACQCVNVHIEQPVFEDGEDSYKSSEPDFRGDLIAIPCRCENDHSWQLCFAFHKGTTSVFMRVPEET
jgi:hypothetical protein